MSGGPGSLLELSSPTFYSTSILRTFAQLPTTSVGHARHRRHEERMLGAGWQVIEVATDRWWRCVISARRPGDIMLLVVVGRPLARAELSQCRCRHEGSAPTLAGNGTERTTETQHAGVTTERPRPSKPRARLVRSLVPSHLSSRGQPFSFAHRRSIVTLLLPFYSFSSFHSVPRSLQSLTQRKS